MASDGSLSEAPPVNFGSDEGRQQPKERRTEHLTPPPPPKIRSVGPKGRREPSSDLPREEKPSSDLAAASYGPLQPKEDLPREEKPSSDLAAASYGPLQPKEDLPREEKPSSDLAAASYGLLQPKEVQYLSWDTKHVMVWKDARLPKPVYVRKDHSRAFHTYPELDGPFQTFGALQSALNTHARGSSTDTSKETLKERVIRESLFWADGTSIVSTSLEQAERESKDVRRLVEALLDKRNDDEDSKYELENILHWQSICEDAHWYYHLNITLKTQGADDGAGSTNLFFAEVTYDYNNMPGCFLSCFCEVNADGKDEEIRCHGCKNNGSKDMKHPPDNCYHGGHIDVYFPVGFGPCNEKQLCDPRTFSKEDDDEEKQLREEEEERIKESLDYLDDTEFLEEILQKRAKLCP